jgi:hypothetical protein
MRKAQYSQAALHSMDLDSANPIAVEIRQEMATAYFAACRKMVDSLEALKGFDRTVASSALSNGAIKRRAELLEHAAERVYCVIIQREAMKLPLRETFFDDYEIPSEVQARFGPKRRR